MQFKSAAPLYPQRIDGRYLHMEADYFMLSSQEARRIVTQFIHWCLATLKDKSITEWRLNGKKRNSSKLASCIPASGNCDVTLTGDFISSTVYDIKSFHIYDRRMTLDNNHTRVKAELDNDYLSIYKALFSPVPTSSDEWKTALLELFSQQGQVYHMPLQQHDFGAYVNFCPYYNVPCLYRGSFHFYISVVCLSQGTSEIVDSMVSFLKEVSNAFINVNARVALTPLLPPEYCSGHMTYFGSSIPEDGSHQCYDFLPSEWYRHYYFCGAEWFNILSPLVRKHIPTLLEDARLFPSLVVEELPSGSVYVQTKKAIEILDVADLLPSKLLLYDALYPGKMKIKKQYILSQKTTGLISKPRKKWEIVPILPNEITIEDESITFLHGRNIEDQKTDLLN